MAAAAIRRAEPQNQAERETTCPLNLTNLMKVVAQVAIRILFIFTSIFIAAAIVPLSWQFVVVPLTAIGSTLAAGFFFLKRFSPDAAPSAELLPLLRPDRAQMTPEQVRLQREERAQEAARLREEMRVMPAHFPENAPPGFFNASQNCAINAMAHSLTSVPEIAAWFREEIPNDLDGFQGFLAQYTPPQNLALAFAAYVEALEEPAENEAPRPIIAHFNDFLGQFRAEEVDRISVDHIRDVFRTLETLHEPFRTFYLAYDEAVQGRVRVSAGSSQSLRIAMSQVTFGIIDPSPYEQLDAPEAMGVVLNVLPDALKIHVERRDEFNMNGLPAMQDLRVPKRERVGCLLLQLDPNEANPTLPALINRYLRADEEHSLRAIGTDGVEHSYPISRVITEFLDAPPALRFVIKRFSDVKPPKTWLNRIPVVKWFFSAPEWQAVKIHTHVECPEEITIPLQNGENCRYRLASFINHQGPFGGGHYTAGEIRDGNKYLENDRTVTFVQTPEENQLWEERLQQSYMLCYLPVHD